MKINATQLDGYAFNRWTGEGGVSLADPASPNTEATTSSLARLAAIFSNLDTRTQSAVCRLFADSESPRSNHIFVQNLILPALPAMSGDAPGKSSWLIINGVSYALAENLWKKTGNGYLYRSPPGSKSDLFEIVLDCNAGTLGFAAHKLECLSLPIANRLELLLRIDDYYSSGSLDLGGRTNWSFHKRNATSTNFGIAKFADRHSSLNSKKDEIRISKAFLGDMKGEIGDFELIINQFSFKLSADRFTAKKTGVWIYDSRHDPDMQETVDCHIVLDMNRGRWSFLTNGTDSSGVFSPDGTAKLILKIGERGASEEMILHQNLKWRIEH